MANTENIEAKLCAYIDGDLDTQGRAEIEKHLAANPQHRTLIEQLSKQRDLLRELPRESAPEEILDALQSQMERSVLLGDDDAAQEAAAMKIHRWPQLMAAAAIVVLTVGLGLVIYFVLPRNSGDANYAVMSKSGATLEDGAAEAGTESGSIALGEATPGDIPSPTSPSKMAAAAAATPSASASADANDREPLSKSADKSATLADAAGLDPLHKDKAADVFAPAAPMVGTDAGQLAIAQADLAGLQRQLQNADLAKQLKSTAPGGIQDNPMFVIVSTADPSATRSEVTNYLATNKIAWDSVSHPTPELQVAQNQAVNLSRSQRVNVRMKNGDVQQQQQLEQTQTQTQALQQEQGGFGEAQQRKFEGKSAAGAAGTADSANRSSTGAGTDRARENASAQATQGPAAQEQEQQRLESAAQAPAAGGAAQPGLADSKLRMSQRSNEVTSNVIEPDEGLLQATTQAPKQQVQDQKQMRVAAQPATESRLIIARGMTKQQAVELQSNLSKQTTVQRAAVYEPRPLAMKRELSPFGGEGAAATRSAPTTEPLPTYKELDAKLLAAAPSTTAPVPPADAGGWRDGDAPVVSRQTNAAGAPTTQDALSAAIATTTPSTSSGPGTTTLPLGTSDALTLAAVPTTAPAGAVADERLDVVILVEDDAQLPAAAAEVMEEFAAPNAAPTAAPTIEPTAAPTTQAAPDATPAP
jgi:predicted anti-sigma-YlaC factor YlaD